MDEIFDLLNLDLNQPPETLARWWVELNRWQWPKDLRPVPEGYTDDPEGWIKWPLNRRMIYIWPLMQAIKDCCPIKEKFRLWHTECLGKTNEEFESWWNSEEGELIRL